MQSYTQLMQIKLKMQEKRGQSPRQEFTTSHEHAINNYYSLTDFDHYRIQIDRKQQVDKDGKMEIIKVRHKNHMNQLKSVDQAYANRLKAFLIDYKKEAETDRNLNIMLIDSRGYKPQIYQIAVLQLLALINMDQWSIMTNDEFALRASEFLSRRITVLQTFIGLKSTWEQIDCHEAYLAKEQQKELLRKELEQNKLTTLQQRQKGREQRYQEKKELKRQQDCHQLDKEKEENPNNSKKEEENQKFLKKERLRKAEEQLQNLEKEQAALLKILNEQQEWLNRRFLKYEVEIIADDDALKLFDPQSQRRKRQEEEDKNNKIKDEIKKLVRKIERIQEKTKQLS